MRGCPILLVVALLVGACAHDSEVRAPRQVPASITGVTVAVAQRQTVAETLDVVGTVKSAQQSALAAKSPAQVVRIHVHEGNQVRRGQRLIDLDARDIRAQIDKAHAGVEESREAREEVAQAVVAARKALEAAAAQHEVANATLRRYQALLEQKSVAPQEYEEIAARTKVAAAEVERAKATVASLVAKQRQVAAKVKQAQAEAANAQVLLSHTSLLAPFDGVVTALPATVGDMAMPGVSLLTVETERYLLEVATEESTIGKLQKEQSVTVSIDAVNRRLRGTVAEIVPAADSRSRTFLVKVALPTEAGVRSGMYGKATFVTGRRESIVIPQEAVIARGQLQSVLVVAADDVAALRLITTGKSQADQVEVLSGLVVGERLVVSGAGEGVAGGKLVLNRPTEPMGQ